MIQDSVELRPAPFLALVVPCYNEEAVLPDSMKVLADFLEELKNKGQIAKDSSICYVDDGSTDTTWSLLENRHRTDPFCRAIKLSGNVGQQNALWAGLETALKWNVDCAITVDVDLQDDINVIPEMIEMYRKGNDIVYGVRSNRDTDSFFKRESAHLFYEIMGKLDLKIVPDHSEFRLMDNPVLKALQGFEERNLFIRGLVPILGFKSAKVYYKRMQRKAGKTNYSLNKLISIAWQGITSCSVLPLRMAGLFSFISMIVAIVLGIAFISKKYIFGAEVPGWTSLFIAIIFMGSVQLFCLAVMGEYIAKIFTEVRRRPRYIIEKEL